MASKGKNPRQAQKSPSPNVSTTSNKAKPKPPAAKKGDDSVRLKPTQSESPSPKKNTKLPARAGSKSPTMKGAISQESPMLRMSNEYEQKEKQLERISLDLRTKQRMLDGANKGLEGLDKKLKDQLIAKDRLIQQMNNASIEKRAKAKEVVRKSEREQEAEMQRLTQENKQLHSINTDMQARLLEIETKYKQDMEALHQEKDEVQALQDVINLEQEKAQSESTAAQRQLTEARGDMENLSKIVKDMTQLNNDLDGKVRNMNNEIENLNSENFTLKSMKDSFQELEQNLANQVEENTNLIKQVKRLTTYNEYFEREKTAGEEVYSQVQGTFNRLEGMLRDLTASTGSPTTEIVNIQTEVRHMLKLQLCKQMPENLDKAGENTKKSDINTLKRDLADRDRLITSLKNDDRSIKNKMANMDAIMIRTKKEAKEEEGRRQVRITRLTEENNTLKQRLENAMDDLQKKDLQLATLNSNAESGQNKANAQSRRIQDLQSKVSKLEDSEKKLRGKLLQITGNSEQREQALAAREARILKSAAQVKAFEEELFYKDNELIKMARNITVLEKSNAELQKKFDIFTKKMASKNTNEIQDQNKKIAEKDGEIKVLKDMIRSSQSQVKASAIDAQTQRKKAARTQRPDTAAMATILQIMRIFYSQVKEVQIWKSDMLSKVKALNRNFDPMPLTQLRTILDFNVSGPTTPDPNTTINSDPQEAINSAGRSKESKIVTETQQRLSTAKRIKIKASELIDALRQETLNRALRDRDDISTQDLSSIIPDLI